jgi:hypothetical protein
MRPRRAKNLKGKLEQRTVYAITIAAILAVTGGWAFAATFVNHAPPAQNSGVTVVAPNGAAQTVQSTQLITVSPAIVALAAAGTQSAGNGGLNSTYLTNVVLNQCAVANCTASYAAVNPSDALVAGTSALQVTLAVPQSATTAVGFDIQVEVIYDNSSTNAAMTVFGSGYFDTSTSTNAGGSSIAVFLYVDLGTIATVPPSVTDVVITLNGCTSATTCP